MHYKKRKTSKIPFIIIALVLVAAIGVTLFWAVGGFGGGDGSGVSVGGVSQSSAPWAGGSAASGAQPGSAQPVSLPEEMRAMWIAYLEWENTDISTEAGMRSVAGSMFDNCAAMGLNTVIVHVRPFGDALYRSELFPWSHLITGTQGEDPGYDPLAVMVEEAHARGLRIEAFFNPYRVQLTSGKPSALAPNNPAVVHPEWARAVGDNGGVYYDPALPEVQQLIVDGAREIAQNYNVDGICMDDYFYQDGITEAFDAESYAQYSGGMALADWRRQNVNNLVQGLYAAIKEVNPAISFGISPAGNNDNNYTMYYADVKLWMANPGYVDYVMPQLYWGSSWESNGNTRFSFDNILREWGEFPRTEGVHLYAALGAYRIGVGDGSAGDPSEWLTGSNMARQVELLRSDAAYSGFSLYRYENLYDGSELAAQEVAALTQLLFS